MNWGDNLSENYHPVFFKPDNTMNLIKHVFNDIILRFKLTYCLYLHSLK